MDKRQVSLCVFAAVLDGKEQRGIGSALPGEVLRIDAIVLLPSARPLASIKLRRIGDDHLVPECCQHSADPGRVRARLQHDASRFEVTEPLLDPGSAGRQGRLLDNRPQRTQLAQLRPPVAKIKPNGYLRDRRAPKACLRLHGRPPV